MLGFATAAQLWPGIGTRAWFTGTWMMKIAHGQGESLTPRISFVNGFLPQIYVPRMIFVVKFRSSSFRYFKQTLTHIPLPLDTSATHDFIYSC